MTTVFTALRLGLHLLVLGLTAFAVTRDFLSLSPARWGALAGGIVFLFWYGFGVWGLRSARRQIGVIGRTSWVVVLILVWAGFTWCSPEASFLAFPLFFVYLRALPQGTGMVAVLVTMGIAILSLGSHRGFTVGGIVGPAIGATVALAIGFGYRALTRQAEERERLLTELIHTRQQLAASEREQGALAERARLARDIHDTVAQGLSSIQMLLRAAERDITAAPEPASSTKSLEYVQMARQTAAESLAETRHIIRELTPQSLDDGLAAALHRLAQEHTARTGLTIQVDASSTDLPMQTQTALLRLAQGALSNVARHAQATRAQITVHDDTTPAGRPGERQIVLVVEDNGRGFDVEHIHTHDGAATQSFGLRAMRERTQQLGGSLEIHSTEGTGTTVRAIVPWSSQGSEESS